MTLLRPHGLWATRLLCPWHFPGKNTRVGCLFLLQGIFPEPGIESESPALAGGFFATVEFPVDHHEQSGGALPVSAKQYRETLPMTEGKRVAELTL